MPQFQPTSAASNAAVTAVRWRARVAAMCGGLLLAMLGAIPAAAALSAGSVIENQAVMTYVDAASGLSSRLASNTVRVTVQPLPALVLAADRSVQRTPGSRAVFPHRLTNTGNAAAQVRFTVNAGRIVVDANGNGVADPGEAVLDLSAALPLAADATADLLLEADVPADAVPGSRITFQLTATEETGISATNTDSVEVIAGPALHVTKAALTPTAVPGGEAVFRITAANTGNVAAGGLPLLVDGAARSLLVINDTLPANTQIISINGAYGAALYHWRGEAANSWHANPPADAANADAVAWALERLEAGQTVAFDIRLQVAANAAGAVDNTAVARYDNGTGLAEAASNSARVSLPAKPPTLTFYHDAAFGRVADAAAMGEMLYLQADAAACNRDPQVAEQIALTLTSARTGDTETYIVGETTPNSGMFRILRGVQTADMATATPVGGDGMMSLRQDDRITASLAGCGAAMTEAWVLIDPYGVVFDSRSNAPVAGATVSLIDVAGAGNGGKPGQPAVVFAVDGVTPAPSTVVTDAQGRYAFPLVPSSEYRLAVVPPGEFIFPSILPAALLPGGRVIDPAASYGKTFPVNSATGAVRVDVPLDASTGTGLFLRKRAARDRVEIGDFIDYTIEIKNVSGHPASNVTLRDVLPPGFASHRPSPENLKTPTLLGAFVRTASFRR